MTILIGTADNDTINGTASADELYGLDGDDALDGGEGDDLLDGGIGADVMAGGAGDDVYLVEDWFDVVVEAADGGIDEVRVGAAVFYTPDHVEKVVGTSAEVQWLQGNGLDNEIWAGAGGGGIMGGDGDDILHHNAAGGHVSGGSGHDVVILAGSRADYAITRSGYVFPDDQRLQVFHIASGISSPMSDVELFSFAGDSTTYTIAALFDRHGTAGDDAITGDDSMNYLYGYDGNDLIEGFGGADWIDGGTGADVMIGGAGEDMYIVDDAGDVIVEDADGGTYDHVRIYTALYTLAANLEAGWAYGAADTTIIGNAGANRLIGNVGADRLEGHGGDDLLEGRGGADTMIGGAGNDVYIVEDAGDVVLETAGGGIDRVGTTLAVYTLPAFVEDLSLWQSRAFRTIAGNALANRFEMTADPGISVDGGAGIDTVDYGTHPHDGVLVDLVTGEMGGTAAGDVLTAIENLTGSGGDDELRGTNGANILNGLWGDDILIGRGGNDVYYVHEQGDVIVEAAGEGSDEIRVDEWIDEYAMPDHVEKLRNLSPFPFIGHGNALNNDMTGASDEDTFFGGDGHDMLSGGGGDDFLHGEAGHDTLNGGDGADTLAGGDGNDAYIVESADDVIVELADEGIDSVFASASAYSLPEGVENLSANGYAALAGTGNAAANLLTGGGAADMLAGGQGDDELRGMGGDDALSGDDGADLIVGGGGADVMAGGEGADQFRFGGYESGTGAAADRIADFVSGTDSIDLSQIDAEFWAAGNQAFNFIGAAAFGGVAGELRHRFDGTDTWIEADTDGDGLADFEIVLTGAVALTGGDFVL